MSQFKNLKVTTSWASENNVDWASPPSPPPSPLTPPYAPTTPPSWSNIAKFGGADNAKKNQKKISASSQPFIPPSFNHMDLITKELEKMDDLALEQATSNSFIADGLDEYDDDTLSNLPTTWMQIDMVNNQFRYSMSNTPRPPSLSSREYPITNKKQLGQELFSIVIGERGKWFNEYSDYTNLDCLTQQPRFQWTHEAWATTRHPRTKKPKFYTLGPEKTPQKMLKTIYFNPYSQTILAVGGDQRLRERVLKLIFFKFKRTDKYLRNGRISKHKK